MNNQNNPLKDTNVPQSENKPQDNQKGEYWHFTNKSKDRVLKSAVEIQNNVYHGFDHKRKPIMQIPTPEYGLGDIYSSEEDNVMIANINDYIVKVNDHQVIPLSPNVFKLISPLIEGMQSRISELEKQIAIAIDLAKSIKECLVIHKGEFLLQKNSYIEDRVKEILSEDGNSQEL